MKAEPEVQQNLTKIQEETITMQECFIVKLKHNVEKCLNFIPTLKDIGKKFKIELEDNSHNSPTITPLPPQKEIPDLTVTQPKVVQGIAAHPGSITTQPLPSHDRIHKRNLIVEGISRFLGKAIQKEIFKYNGHSEAKVDKVFIRQHQKELKCKYETDASYFKRELQQNQTLNRTLVFLPKTFLTFVMIQLGVLNQNTVSQIKKIIQTNFQTRENEQMFLVLLMFNVTRCKEMDNNHAQMFWKGLLYHKMDQPLY